MKSLLLQLSLITPVFGLWSCKSKNVPFVCIEPWYGRTDAIDFTGELKDREYSNHLDAGEVFEKSFSILFINNIINIKTAPYAIVCNIALFFMQSDYFKNICIKLLFVFVYGW